MPVTTNEGPQRPEVIYHATPPPVVESTRPEEDEATSATIAGGSTLELIGGAGAVVLAVLALAGYMPVFLTSLACIAIGGALVAHGASVAARWNDTIGRVGTGIERAEVAGGLSSEVLGGLAGITLGVLALVGMRPMLVLPIAAIVLGCSVLFGALAEPPIARFARNLRTGEGTFRGVAASSATMALAGIGAVVLGILALLRVGSPLVLSTVAMLAVGGALAFSGGTRTSRFAGRRHAHA